MSSEPSELALELVRRDADACVLAVSGELSLCSAGLVTRAVSKALLDVGRVLVDVSGLRLTRPSAAQLFPTTLMAVGGWPGARLVLFGVNPELARSLTAMRVAETVPLASDEAAARRLLGTASTGRCPLSRSERGGRAVLAASGTSVRQGGLRGLAAPLDV